MPNRIIKETIRSSKNVSDLSDFGFRVWVYLITVADDYGRGMADTDLLCGVLFPRRRNVTEAQLRKAISELSEHGMIQLYEVDGEKYFFFPNWDTHQSIRAKRSKFPAPSDSVNSSASTCMQMHANVPVIQSNPIQSESESESKESIKENLFEQFWEAYPRRVDKKKTRMAFDKAVKGKDIEAVVYEMLNSIREWQSSGAWDDEQFIPYSATWLNGSRWTAKPPRRRKKDHGYEENGISNADVEHMVIDFNEGE